MGIFDIFGYSRRKLEAENKELKDKLSLAKKEISIGKKKNIVVSSGASSSRDLPINSIEGLMKSMRTAKPGFEFDVIPLIRKLSRINPDVNQALNDFTKLANTGHKITFDPSVGADQIDEMRVFIEESALDWHHGAAGMSGIVNKMFRQLQIGGAISNEWIPNMNLNNIDQIRFINPENIRFVVDKRQKYYHPYQKLKNKIENYRDDLKKLNTNQYKYYALNGDTDVPYGIPPYLASLDPISTQTKMVDNIKFVIEAMGLLGYIDAKIDKPLQQPGENDKAYEQRLISLLDQMKERVTKGLRDGVNVGFIDDHEFEFKQTTKTAQGVKELYEMNELLIASGLNYDAIFMGRPGATETLVTVMFTKMLAQLTNIQNIVKINLEFGYRLALSLGGFSFKSLKVEFNRSTITDDLKYQQAQEILRRNLIMDYQYGLIGLEDMADKLNYVKPDQKSPRIDINNHDPATGEVKRQKKEKGKDASDKKGRDKKNPQGTVKRQNSDEDNTRVIKIS